MFTKRGSSMLVVLAPLSRSRLFDRLAHSELGVGPNPDGALERRDALMCHVEDSSYVTLGDAREPTRARERGAVAPILT